MTGYLSVLYEGAVMHRRFRPRPHHLRYRLYSILFDLDEVHSLDRGLRLFSQDRFNLFAFYGRDHGDGSATPLRVQIESLLRAAGLDPDGGAIRLLCMPRVLGHVFNPISIFYCHRRDGSLQAILYEVNNTFGERHSYLIPVAPGTQDSVIRQRCDKRFYVSPFMDMAMTYDFRLRIPAAALSVVIHGRDADGLMIAASQTGERRPLSDAALVRVFLLYPLLTLKVVAGIHWEALRLWLKGNKLRFRPPAPASAVTTVLTDHG
jgi:DUF1365 family protein